MNYHYTPKETERVAAARDSFSGRLLTDRQFDEAMAITSIIESEISRTGTFKDKLGDYAYAFARTQKMDVARAETVIRDLYKERTGQTMNQSREAFVKSEEQSVTDTFRQAAYEHACEIGTLIETGNKMSFHRAYAHQAQKLASEKGVTDSCAKRVMKEEFAAVEDSALYDWGKALEDKYFRPQIEEEKQQRNPNRTKERSHARTSPSGSARKAARHGGPEMRR